MSQDLLTYRGTVYPSQCDHMGHMNVALYVAKFDEATWQLFAAIGLTPARLRDENIRMAGVEQHIEYKRELYPGDVVTVSSKILDFCYNNTPTTENNTLSLPDALPTRP